MAITNYSELVAAVADWLNRDDLTGVIPTFISLAEATFNRELRLGSQIKRTTLTIADGSAFLPDDFLEIQKLTDRDGNALRVLSPELLTPVTGSTPHYFSIIGDSIYVEPAASATLTLVYYARIPGLTDAQPSTPLLLNNPDLYLYMALSHSAPYLKDDARLQTWVTLATDALDRVRVADENRRWEGTTIRMIPSKTFG